MILGHLAANADPNHVYRYYDHAWRILYIGITARGPRRQDEHAGSSAFFDYVKHQQIEACHSREEALRLERELIKAFRPPFNKTHNGGWEILRTAYLGIVAAEETYARALDGIPSAAKTRRSSIPQQCEHCSWCLSGRDEDDGICEALNNGDPCDVCGRPDCLFMAGYSEGSMDGYQRGWESGVEGTADRRYNDGYNYAVSLLSYTLPPGDRFEGELEYAANDLRHALREYATCVRGIAGPQLAEEVRRAYLPAEVGGA